MAEATQVQIPVEGMTCAACQARVQRALVRVPGVEDASVNLLAHRASVRFDPSRVRAEDLVAAIVRTGYEARLEAPIVDLVEEQAARDRADDAEYRGLRVRAIVSGVAGAVAMVASMPLMAPVASVVGDGHAHGVGEITDPLMRWVMVTVHPALSRVAPWLYAIDRRVLGWALLLLTAAVMAWAGRHFYVRAWRTGRHGGADMNTLVAVGTGAAFLYSLVATVAPGIFLRRGLMPDVYFEAVILIIALILTGRAFEARAKRRTSSALRALVEPAAPHGARRPRRRRAGRARRGRHDRRPGARASGRTAARRRPRRGRHEQRGRVDADGRVGAGLQAGGRHRHWRHGQRHGRDRLPRHDARAPPACCRGSSG